MTFPTQGTFELRDRPCPVCGEPATSVLADVMATATPEEKPSAFGVVPVNVSAEPMMFTFHPCGCRVTPDGKPVRVEEAS